MCGKTYHSYNSLKYHLRQCRKRHNTSQEGAGDTKKKCIRCRKCGFECEDRRQLSRHHISQHGNAVDLQEFKVDLGDDAGLQNEYETNRSHILAPDRQTKNGAVYNFPTNDLKGGFPELEAHLNKIYNQEDHAFRLNLAIGMLLRDIESGETRYYIPYENEMVFPAPQTISSRRDLKRVLDKLRSLDIREYVNNNKSTSSLKPQFVTNLAYNVYRTSYPLGGTVELPQRLKEKRTLIGLEKDSHGVAYNDRLCLLRCLNYHRHGSVTQAGVEHLLQEWCNYTNIQRTAETFSGVNMDELPTFEDCFQTNVNMYEYVVDTECVIPRYLTQSSYNDTLYVNLYENHTSYITNFNGFAKKFQCPQCLRNFSLKHNWNRHLKVCTNIKKVRFPGGFYSNPKTIFQELADYEVNVPKVDQMYPYFAVFDMESILQKINDKTSDKLCFTQRHVPISVSVNSNVPGFESPYHIVDQNLDVLLEQMVSYMTQISDTAARLTRQKLQPAFEILQDKLKSVPARAVTEHVRNEDADEHVGFDDSDLSDDDGEFDRSFIDDQEIEEDYPPENPYLNPRVDFHQEQDTPRHDYANRLLRNALLSLESKLGEYCARLPVLGFNSAKYDLNLIKAKLAKHLDLGDKDTFVIKRANAYTCISTPQFKFLDITSYLAAGASYAKFLKAYGVEEEKGFFPYDWFDTPEKLDYAHLPPYEAFYSKLKAANVLEIDGQGQENYAMLQTLWQTKNMSSFRDFLKYYNNADVIGFVQAVEKMLKFYFDNEIDLFKITISLPNLARIELFKCGNSLFPLFDANNQDLYRTIQQGIAGGPSIIFKREAEAGVTPIRNNPNVIGQRILGHDANGLYAYCIAQQMPTGLYVDRREENDFKGELSQKYVDMFFWMDWLAFEENIVINHKLNSGKEVRIGPYLVDGYCADTRTVYEYQGCWYHYCEECQIPSRNPATLKRQENARKRTQEKRHYLEDNNYTVVEMKECYFKKNLRKRTELFQTRYLPPFYTSWKGKMSLYQILDNVLRDKLFGLVECDISIPDDWSDEDELNIYFQNDLPPKDFFADMPPLFCTTDVPFEHFGEHMKSFVQDNNLSQDSRRLLVGGMRAKKILLITPLLKWYLQTGLRVTRIYRVVEFTPKACFKELTDRVAQARRDGDRDPERLGIIADTNKLLICSAYGGLLLNKEKHRTVKYVTSERELRIKVNDPKFYHFKQIDDNFFEVEMLKNKITLDLPNYLGFFVLNYAKLHMLQFVYDVLYEYIPRNRFELMEMDTDSIYAFYAGQTLESVMDDDDRNDFKSQLLHSCDRDHVDASTGHWFPRECCAAHKAYDKRTPGLFKLEASGNYMICLSSKTYMLQNDDTVKFSCKGVQKRHIRNPAQVYRSVLKSRAPHQVQNQGFRARENTMQTYQQNKTGFSYFYVKREVLANGVDTKPLALTLCPWKSRNDIIVDPGSVLSNQFAATIEMNNIPFFSAHQCFMHEAAVYHEQMDRAFEILYCQNAFELNKIKVDFKPTIEWYEHATAFLQILLEAKRNQCPEFAEELGKHRGKEIYIAGRDKYWTCGFQLRIARVLNASQYPGCNVLGNMLYNMINN